VSGSTTSMTKNDTDLLLEGTGAGSCVAVPCEDPRAPATTLRLLLLMLWMASLLTGCDTLRRENDEAWRHFESNVKIVRGAKRAYQAGHNLPNGTPVTWEQLRPCLPAGWKPVCLAGGVLTPGVLGEEMTCSVHGQLHDPAEQFLRRK
jgi:hypothetical protein